MNSYVVRSVVERNRGELVHADQILTCFAGASSLSGHVMVRIARSEA